MEFSGVYYKRMGNNPAQVDRESRELFVNPDIWPYLPSSFKTWILLHEEGHLKGGVNGQPTADEILADKYAFENYVGSEKESLRKSVLILHKTLPKHSANQWKRIIVMYARALDYDYRHNGNKEALEELNLVREQLKGYVDIPTIPIDGGSKSNLVPIIVAGIIGLASTIIGSGASVYSSVSQRKNAQALSDENRLHSQTAESDALAASFIYNNKNNTNEKLIIYGSVVLVVIAVLVLYLKRRIRK